MDKRLSILIFIAISCWTVSVFGQREVITINDAWKFSKSDDLSYAAPQFNDSKWAIVTIPHCWNAKDALEKADYYKGPGWYRKALYCNVQSKKRYFLHFEGALLTTSVCVNGTMIGEHIGGYTAFSFDITSALKNGKNEIAVRVDNASREDAGPQSGDFTFWGGLYRDVYLIETDPVHFQMNNVGSTGVFFYTPQVAEKSARVAIKGEVTNDLSVSGKYKIVARVCDAAGNLVFQKTSLIKLLGHQTNNFVLMSIVGNPHLWSPEDPYLYRVSVCIETADGKVKDELNDHLGIRWFSVDTQNGFLLNGKPIKLTGVARHQDYVGLGSAMSNDMHRRDAHLIKEMGANFVRISHYPQDPSFLDACDEEGILAWEEIPIVNYITDTPAFFENSKKNLTEMIRQHYNHPSVVMWGYMNEVLVGAEFNSKTREIRKHTMDRTVELAKELEQIIRKEDPTRLSTMAWHNSQIYNESGIGMVPKIIGWNIYDGWYVNEIDDLGKQMDEEHAKYPDRPLIISEYGSGSDKRLHTLHPELYDFSIEFQQAFHERYMPQILSRKFIVGSTVWNFIDFGSAWRQETMPHINNKGLVYANRETKDVYYYYKALLRHDPVIHIASRDWNERKGIPARKEDSFVIQPVKIYSNLSEIELYLNGRSLGIQHPVNRYTVYDVPFTDGDNILEAKSVLKDSVVMDAMTVNFKVQPYDLRKAGNKIEIGVNAGSNCFYTNPQSHFIYEPDQPYREGSWGYIGGTIYRSDSHRIGMQSDIHGTEQGPLFQTLREGVKAYKFDVPDGDYELTLSFAAPISHEKAVVNDMSKGETRSSSYPIFDVSVNDCPIIKNLDLISQYGSLIAVEKTFQVRALQGKGVTVRFISIQGEPIINALKIRKVN